MSLRVFHIFFIAASSALGMLGGFWALDQGKNVLWAASSFAVSAALDVYLVWFIIKSKKLGSS